MHLKSHFKNKAIIFLAFLSLSFTGFAQAPNLLNYQGVARNAVGNPLPNQTMKLRLSIHDLLPSGAVVYSEIRQITTNLGGLFSVQIGSAGASSNTGTIAGVNWIVGNKFLQVELDPASNNNYIDIGTVQLVSVPFSFAAGTAATVKTNANLTGVVTSVGNATSVANGAITSDMIGTLNKSKVGLDLVNNTSDAAKPISTLAQAALGNKLNIADSTSAYVTPTQLAASKLDSTSISNRINLKANTSSLATVATSGSYNDLTNKPAVPDAYSLPSASASSLGGIKVGNNLSIDGNGFLSASAAGVPYTGALQAVDLGAFDLKVNGMTVGRGLNVSTESNVGIGKDVLRSVTGGSYLTAVGHESLYSNTTGYNNTAIGSAALEFNTTGAQNSAFGLNALKNNTTGSDNTATGVNALESNINGNENTANGVNALQSNTEGRQNSAFGFSALKSNTTGKYNTATGFNALSKNTTGEQNTATGWYALQANTTGANNTAFGWAALYPNTTGANNTAVGEGALKNNSTGDENSAFGEGTLANNTTGIYNSAFGRESLEQNRGDNNTAIGWRSGNINQTGNNNTAIGSQANFGANNLTNATAIGYQANASASNSIQLGNTAVTNVKTSGTITAGAVTYPKVDGTAGQVLSSNGAGVISWVTPSTGGIPYTGASQAVDLGAFDLKVNSLAVGKGGSNIASNTAVGKDALLSNNTFGSDNTAMGNIALYSNTYGRQNTAIGSGSLNSNTNGLQNTAVGILSLEKNVGVSYNTAVGAEALRFTVDGESNTATGASALRANISGAYNSAFGRNALSKSTASFNNVAFGAEALSDNLANGNAAYGAYALQRNTTGYSNTAIGLGAMKFHTTGNDNVAIGVNAGLYQSVTTTGSSNTAVGAFSEYGAANLSNATVIGYGATVSASNSIRLGNTAVTTIGGQVAWTAASDSRIKKNIINSNYGLSTVLKLRPVEYNLISNDLRQVGFIAQEVQKLVPEVVTGKEGDLSKGEILGITYSNLVPVLTKAIQEQQKQIEELKALVNQLINKKN